MNVFLIVLLIVSHIDTKPSRALQSAAENGDLRAVRALVGAGADVNLADGAGTTPLMAAAAMGRTDVVAVLADAGADVDLRDRLGRTALDRALAAGQGATVRLLIQRGAVGSGKSPGDTVCMERWAGSGFCGAIERVAPHRLRVRVTRVVGCDAACSADDSCSEGKEVDPSSVGDLLWVDRSCLTRTFPGSGSPR
jgi:Ankyrin repeats (3 copies)